MDGCCPNKKFAVHVLFVSFEEGQRSVKKKNGKWSMKNTPKVCTRPTAKNTRTPSSQVRPVGRERRARTNFASDCIKHKFFKSPNTRKHSDFRKDIKQEFGRFNKKQNTLTGGGAFFVSTPFSESNR